MTCNNSFNIVFFRRTDKQLLVYNRCCHVYVM